MRAVGNRLYARPPKETLHEFMLNLLKWTLGKEWYFGELKKSPEEQQQIVRWYIELGDWSKRVSTEENRFGHGWSAIPSGGIQALLALAYDVYTLLHSGELPNDLLRRLKDRRAFQGARYEVAVAAIFARMQYKIEWVEDTSKKHCEFIARHESGSPRSQWRPRAVTEEVFCTNPALWTL